MNWLDIPLSRLAEKRTKRGLRLSAIGWLFVAGAAVISDFQGPVDKQFPQNQTLYSIQFWLSCIAIPIILLVAVAEALAIRHVLDQESKSASET